MAWCSRPPPPTLSGQRCPALDRWWPGGHEDACGLGLHAASGEGGQQGSLDASPGCLLGPRSHSELSSRGSGLGPPRGPESWGAAEADVSVACRRPLGWTTLSLTRFSFQRRWRPGQVGGGSAQGPPGPARVRGPRVRAWGQGGAQGAVRLCSPCWAPALPSGLGGYRGGAPRAQKPLLSRTPSCLKPPGCSHQSAGMWRGVPSEGHRHSAPTCRTRGWGGDGGSQGSRGPGELGLGVLGVRPPRPARRPAILGLEVGVR